MVVVVVVVGCGAWVVNQLLDPRPLSWAILAVGGAVSVWYLLRQVVLLVQRPRRPLQIDITDADLPSSQDAVPGGRASLTQSTRPSSTSSATGPSHRL